MTTGLRFEHRNADYTDSNGLGLSPTDSMIGGQISLNHALNDYHNIYSTLSRGYKAGGFNLSPSLADEQRQYEPEFLLNLEAGIKGYFLDYRLSLNISAFYAKRTDMQVSTSIQSDPSDPLTFIFFTGNAASGKNYGLEADWRYSVSRHFSLHGSLGLLHATFVDYVTVDADFSGREQAQAPNYQFNLGAEYIADGGFFARVDINGRDGFYYSNSHDQKSDAYSLVNFKLGYEAQSWALYLWGRNIFNKQYTTRGFFFGLEPPDFPDTLYTQLGDPSHFGISAEFNF
ncbi:MAG: TonB-dependent receptor [Proteobacteria bacterium]|nr:TonB-dependent receptor [Pseudomonadota bacterium]